MMNVKWFLIRFGELNGRFGPLHATLLDAKQAALAVGEVKTVMLGSSMDVVGLLSASSSPSETTKHELLPVERPAVGAADRDA